MCVCVCVRACAGDLYERGLHVLQLRTNPQQNAVQKRIHSGAFARDIHPFSWP